MSKGLEELKRLAYENACKNCQYWGKKGCSCCYPAGVEPCVWLGIEKELKALEIIRIKQVNVCSFIHRKPKTFEEYQDIDDSVEQLSEVSLSKEEYELLKEVLL